MPCGRGIGPLWVVPRRNSASLTLRKIWFLYHQFSPTWPQGHRTTARFSSIHQQKLIVVSHRLSWMVHRYSDTLQWPLLSWMPISGVFTPQLQLRRQNRAFSALYHYSKALEARNTHRYDVCWTRLVLLTCTSMSYLRQEKTNNSLAQSAGYDFAHGGRSGPPRASTCHGGYLAETPRF